jgi:hypothetical protein
MNNDIKNPRTEKNAKGGIAGMAVFLGWVVKRT